MQVKELMIPVAEYTTVQSDATLVEVFQALAKAGHRDVLVLGDKGAFMGTMTMLDVLVSLEPTYKKLLKKGHENDMLSSDYVAQVFKEFGLWSDSLKSLCKKGGGLLASEVMYTPAESEYLNEEDELEKGLHQFIVGTHQPLIVRKGREVTGVLRMSDVFTVVKKLMVECSI